jgi:hypothetical protein
MQVETLVKEEVLMRMQMESLWSEIFRLRENDMRLTRENENLHELLDSHNRRAGCLDDGDCDNARAADAVCDGLDDSDIGDHVPARPLALAGSDGVPDADAGVSNDERRPLPVSILDHHDSALHTLCAGIRADYPLGGPISPLREVKGDMGGICRVGDMLWCGGTVDLVNYGHLHEDTAVRNAFNKVGIG